MHYYFDDIPENTLLFISVRLVDQIPVFNLSSGYYLENYDLSFIIEMLKNKIRSFRKKYGPNYCEVCLYECLAANPDILEEMLMYHSV